MKALILRSLIITVVLCQALSTHSVKGQTTTLSLSSPTACAGDTIMVSLNATNLFNIGAITLNIGYDTAVLKYSGQANVHPNFPGLMTNAVFFPYPQVIIAWNSLNPGNLESGKLLDLIFIHKNNSCPVFFRPGAEIVTVNLIPVLFSTENGIVTQLPPYIFANPQNTVVHTGHNAIFTVVALQADQYQWQQFNGLQWSNLQNSAVYQNVNGPQLTIIGVSSSLNNFKYRCLLTATGTCQIYSKSAILNVIPGSSGLPSVYALGGGGTFCEGLVPSGINITLNNSQVNVNYQLYNGPDPLGSAMPGTGSAIVWTDVTAGLYMANATNIFGTVNMNGTVVVDEYPLPELDCPFDFNVLISSPPFPLEGATPTGGEYTGPGVLEGIFYPDDAGLGIHEISYLYTDANNCTNLCLFQITITSPHIPGDANGDGVVNILDAVVTVAFIMGNNPQPFIFEAADVNGDGTINIQDVVLIVNIIMGQ